MALSPWVKPIAYCESDRYAQGALLSRMADGQLHQAPIWDDVRTLDGTQFRGEVDIIFGGFPCQDVSSQGARRGLEAERSGLFFEIVRLAKEIKPTFLFLENVAAIRTYLPIIAQELAGRGYDCRWDVVSAQEVGALHVRKRWFCLAYAMRERGRIQQRRGLRSSGKNSSIPFNDGLQEPLAHTDGEGLEASGREKQKINGSAENGSVFDASYWTTEPDVGRVVNGLPMRVDRIRCLGNAVVPLQAREAFKRLCGLQ